MPVRNMPAFKSTTILASGCWLSCRSSNRTWGIGGFKKGRKNPELSTNVFDQVIRQGECFVTLVRLERFVSCVGSLMSCQIISLGECLVTLVTVVRLLPCVGYIMSRQAIRHCECLDTLVTLERLLSCVGSLMSRQMARVCKFLVTLVTQKFLYC